MVDKSELKTLAKNVVEEILNAYKEHKLVDYVSNALGIRFCQSLIGNEWVTDTIELQVTSGGPNVWVRVEEDKITGEVYWGSEKAEYEYYTRKARDILEILEDIIAHK